MNENETPVVNSVWIHDQIGSGALADDEAAALEPLLCDEDTMTVEDSKIPCEGPPSFWIASQYPWFRINKVVDGETIEVPQIDPASGFELGNCTPQPGAAQVLVGTDAVTEMALCWNPGTRFVSIQPTSPFLAYGQTVSWNLTSNIKDKAGRSLEQPPFVVQVAPFQVLTVKTADFEVPMYAANELFDAPAMALEVPAASAIEFRIFFSGPVDAESLMGARLTNDLAGVATTDVTVQDSAGENVTALFEVSEDDPRVVLVYVPQYQLSSEDDEPVGLDPGTYHLIIPASITDDASVTGTAVPLAATDAHDFTFEVVADEE